MIRSHNINKSLHFLHFAAKLYVGSQEGASVGYSPSVVWGHKSQINIIIGHARALGR